MRALALALVLASSACRSAPVALPPTELVVLSPVDGGLQAQLARHAKEAKASGRVAFAELYGDWCQPCRDLDAAMPDSRMQEAFSGTRIVRLETDLWLTELQHGLWVPERYSVPTFFVLRDDGTFGPSLAGTAWAANVPENMAKPLSDFFRAHGVGK